MEDYLFITGDGKMIKYSIVIPAYNAEMYIREMIKSIKTQTYKNWELIIIDDGSTDGTAKICDEFVDDKIKVYHNENKGQIGARVDGISKASGEYTLVVDADDRLHSDCLESINAVLEKHQYECVAFPYSLCDENMNFTEETVPPEKIGEMSQKEFMFWIIETLNHPLYNKVVKTEKIQKGAEEAIKDRVSINGDYALIIPIVCNTEDVYYLDKSLYDYRVFDKSISHNRRYKQVLDTDVVSKSVVEILDAHGLLEQDIKNRVYKKYLSMVVWLISEINSHRFITNDEILNLHNSVFYQASLKYETKDFVGLKNLLILKAIRKEGKISVYFMNVFIRMVNIYGGIKHCAYNLVKQ